MEAQAAADRASVLRRTRRVTDWIGDGVLHGLTALAAFASLLVVAALVWKVVDGAGPSISHFGIGFVWESSWNPVPNDFGARQFIIGTLVTSFGAMLLAA